MKIDDIDSQSRIDKLKEIREFWGLKQREMAVLINYSPEDYSRIMNGKIQITNKRYNKITNYLLNFPRVDIDNYLRDFDIPSREIDLRKIIKQIMEDEEKGKIINLCKNLFDDRVLTSEFTKWIRKPHPTPYIFENKDYPSDNSSFYSREGEFYEIVKQLSPSSKESMLFITGSGGMGKTALAKKVFHYFLKENCFHEYLYFPFKDEVFGKDKTNIPQQPTLEDLCRYISKKLDVDFVDTLPQENLFSKVRQQLSDRLVLLIIDSFECIKDRRASVFFETLPKSCKTLVTSRVSNPDFNEIRLHELSEHFAKKIIREKLFLKYDLFRDDKENYILNTIGTMPGMIDWGIIESNIINITGGLPGAIEWAVEEIASKAIAVEDFAKCFFSKQSDIFWKYYFQNQFDQLSSESKKLLYSLCSLPTYVNKFLITDPGSFFRKSIRTLLLELSDYSFVNFPRNSAPVIIYENYEVPRLLKPFLDRQKNLIFDHLEEEIKFYITDNILTIMHFLSQNDDSLSPLRKGIKLEEYVNKNRNLLIWTKDAFREGMKKNKIFHLLTFKDELKFLLE